VVFDLHAHIVFAARPTLELKKPMATQDGQVLANLKRPLPDAKHEAKRQTRDNSAAHDLECANDPSAPWPSPTEADESLDRGEAEPAHDRADALDAESDADHGAEPALLDDHDQSDSSAALLDAKDDALSQGDASISDDGEAAEPALLDDHDQSDSSAALLDAQDDALSQGDPSISDDGEAAEPALSDDNDQSDSSAARLDAQDDALSQGDPSISDDGEVAEAALMDNHNQSDSSAALLDVQDHALSQDASLSDDGSALAALCNDSAEDAELLDSRDGSAALLDNARSQGVASLSDDGSAFAELPDHALSHGDASLADDGSAFAELPDESALDSRDDSALLEDYALSQSADAKVAEPLDSRDGSASLLDQAFNQSAGSESDDRVLLLEVGAVQDQAPRSTNALPSSGSSEAPALGSDSSGEPASVGVADQGPALELHEAQDGALPLAEVVALTMLDEPAEQRDVRAQIGDWIKARPKRLPLVILPPDAPDAPDAPVAADQRALVPAAPRALVPASQVIDLSDLPDNPLLDLSVGALVSVLQGNATWFGRVENRYLWVRWFVERPSAEGTEGTERIHDLASATARLPLDAALRSVEATRSRLPVDAPLRSVEAARSRALRSWRVGAEREQLDLRIGHCVAVRQGATLRYAKIAKLRLDVRCLLDERLRVYNVDLAALQSNVSDREVADRRDALDVIEVRARPAPRPPEAPRTVYQLKRRTFVAVWNADRSDYRIAYVDLGKRRRTGKLIFYNALGNDVFAPSEAKHRFVNAKYQVIADVGLIRGGLLVDELSQRPYRIRLPEQTVAEIRAVMLRQTQ